MILPVILNPPRGFDVPGTDMQVAYSSRRTKVFPTATCPWLIKNRVLLVADSGSNVNNYGRAQSVANTAAPLAAAAEC